MSGIAVGRRTLVTGTAGVVVATATGCWTTESSSSPPAPPSPSTRHREATIFDLSFTVASRYRPFALLADGDTTVKPDGAGPLDLADASPVAPFCAVTAEETSAIVS